MLKFYGSILPMLVKISIYKKKNTSVSLQIGSRTKGLSKRDYEVKWSLFETDNDGKKKDEIII